MFSHYNINCYKIFLKILGFKEIISYICPLNLKLYNMNLNTSKTHKECPKCKEIKDRKLDFYQRKSEKVKVSSYCKDCILDSNAERRRVIKQQAIDYLGGKCSNCGYNKCNSALEFHHIDSTQKDKDYSNYKTSFNKLKPELDKCVLLCSNCHREHHSS